MAIFLIIFLNNAFERYSQSSQAIGLGHALTASAQGVAAIRFNPAGLARLDYSEFTCGYEYFLSGIEGLHNLSVGFVRPLLGTGFGIMMSEFGFAEQKEQAMTLASGLGLNQDLMFGLGADLYIINNERLGYGLAYGMNIAFQARLYKKWQLGVYGHNLNRPRFGNSEEGCLDPELRTGLAYTPFDDIRSEVDLSMTGNRLRVHLASEVLLFRILYFRTGIKTNPTVVAAGSGIVYRSIAVDYAIEYIPDLPFTHSINLNLRF
jgi:hypothetical protein